VRISITGGTGFVGRHAALRLIAAGHEVVLIGRGDDSGGDQPSVGNGVRLVRTSITDVPALASAFAGCDAVLHCAGINRELGSQTYATVHVAGTRAVVAAARSAGVPRLAMLSFLRACPDGPSTYHRSKWAAEEIVRGSGLTYTILKAGVIHGRGDHMLDHLSHAFFTFPVFGLVGMRDRPVRPVAVDDVARLLEAAATGDPRMADQTIAVVGPEELPLGDAVRRVAKVAGRRPRFVRLLTAAHLCIARVAELVMRVPLVSLAQVRILSEGIVDALPYADEPPADLAPSTPFSDAIIRAGLPRPGPFGRGDLRWCVGSASA
jgi:uncharacterized protein YbjT (DUF2867 family)